MGVKAINLDELYLSGNEEALLEGIRLWVVGRTINKTFLGFDHEDIIQDVMIRVYNQLAKYNKDRASVSTYVNTVIDSAIKDMFKKAGSNKNLNEYNTFSIDYEPMDGTGDSNFVEDYVSLNCGKEDNGYDNVEFKIDFDKYMGLTTKEKQLFYLKSCGYTFDEIGAYLNIRKSRACQMWSKIKSKYESLED